MKNYLLIALILFIGYYIGYKYPTFGAKLGI